MSATGFLSVPALGTLLACTCLLRLGCGPLAADETPIVRRAVPPIDAAAPASTQAATFALG